MAGPAARDVWRCFAGVMRRLTAEEEPMPIRKARVQIFHVLSAIAVLLVLAGAPMDARAKVFNPVTFTLDNGLQVVVITNRRAPIVTHMIWYKVGAADDPVGKSGLAHFLEHLMFKGTKTLGPGEFSQIIARNGGQENAFTTQDSTTYYQTVAKDRLDIVMKYEADRMTNLSLSDEVVLPERDVVLEERSSRIDRNPSSQLGEALSAVLFLNSPYRLPAIGWEEEIAKLTSVDAIEFYRRIGSVPERIERLASSRLRRRRRAGRGPRSGRDLLRPHPGAGSVGP